jgi:hypothetical protein
VIWPHTDLSLLGIIPAVVLVSYSLVKSLKTRKAAGKPLRALNLPTFKAPDAESGRFTKIVGGFFFFWYDFIIGDDWRVAAAVVIGFLVASAWGANAWWVMPLVVASVLSYTLHEATHSPQKIN